MSENDLWKDLLELSIESEALRTALTATYAGMASLQDRFGKAHTVDTKENASIVTEADKLAEDVICKAIQSNSAYKVLTEESGSLAGEDSRNWIVDPLDGTTNFSRSIPLYATSIALFEGQEPVLGVIGMPCTNEVFAAVRGDGSWLNGGKLDSRSAQEDGQYVVINNGYDIESKTRAAKLWDRFLPLATCRMFGSTAVELCLVASGKAQAFICSGDEVWDYAAGVLICKEAGLQVTDWKGYDFDWSTSFLLVSSANNHGRLVDNAADLQTN